MATAAGFASYNDRVPGISLPLRLRLFRFVGRQSWIPRGQTRLLRAIWNPNLARTFPFEVDFFDQRYVGDLSHWVDWNVFAYGAYALRELTLLAALADQLRRNKRWLTFFDIGANLGHHTLFMSQHADEVIAFEPFPELQEAIREKIRLNHLTNVRVVPYALGVEDTTLDYFPGGDRNSGAGTFVPEAFERYGSPVKIGICAGGRLHSELGLPPIDLLKVDVEGFESQVIAGLRDRIQQDRPPIVMEMSDRCRAGFGSEKAFRGNIYPDAVFAEILGRPGRPYILKPFRYESSKEMLIVPSELGGWLSSQVST